MFLLEKNFRGVWMTPHKFDAPSIQNVALKPTPSPQKHFCFKMLHFDVHLCVLQWLPESARYDMARGQVDRAYATLQRIAADNGKSMPLGRLVDSTGTSDSASTPVSTFSILFPLPLQGLSLLSETNEESREQGHVR